MCVVVFICQFFNTGILLPLSNANFKKTNISLLSSFNGLYTDFTSEWYRDVGMDIVNTMFIQSLMPWVEFFVLLAKIFARRYKDTGKLRLNEITKSECKTVQEFVKVHAGP